MYHDDLFEKYTSAEHGLEKNRIPLRIFRRIHSHQSPVSLHTHNFWEIIIVISGSGHHMVYLPEGEEIIHAVSKGHVCIISPEEKHAFYFQPREELEIINVLFSSLVIQRSDNNNWDDISAYNFLDTYPYMSVSQRKKCQIILAPQELDNICKIIETIENELLHKDLGYNTLIQMHFSIFLIALMRQYYSQINQQLEQPIKSSVVQAAIQYIDRNYMFEITLNELSKYTHYSTRQLTRRFKEVLGLSVNQYILNTRIENAQTLLLSTNHHIETIALETGFNSASYFCQQFKRNVGVTPQKYRNQHQTP